VYDGLTFRLNHLWHRGEKAGGPRLGVARTVLGFAASVSINRIRPMPLSIQEIQEIQEIHLIRVFSWRFFSVAT
jgi:hypothetical protein